jgi:hypothetical protein
MAATVKLRLGNLFDGPTDLVVLPCSTAGTVTDFVARSLSQYRLPSPPTTMQLGQVHFEPFVGGDNISQYVAFAASVQSMRSSPDAIGSIGRSLGELTSSTPSVRAVSAPLLGAGAGGVQSEIVVEQLRNGFVETASPNATLTISVLHRSVYDRFAGNQPSTKRNKPLRVFVSYTATDDQHTKWVEELAKFLRTCGIEARLDRWHLRRGMDLPQWMCNEVKLADKVIIVSNEQYAAKADGRLGGVGWETMLIQGDIAGQSADAVKYIMVVRSDDFTAGTPMYLKTKYAIHWPRKAEEGKLRDDLIRDLLEVSLEPELGAPPVFLA